MNGVTGRMGYRQHLVRSILALREQGGLDLGDGTVLWPEPILVGRREHALKALAEQHGLDRRGPRTSTRSSPTRPSTSTSTPRSPRPARRRSGRRSRRASTSTPRSPPPPTSTARWSWPGSPTRAGIKHGVVQDKLFLPGLLKLKRLIDGGFFGRILSVRGEFGYWVFEGDWQDGPAPVLELPRRGRRRHRRRHVPALGVRAARAVRPGDSPSRPSPPRTSRSAGTSRTSRTTPPPTTPPTASSSSRAAPSPRSTPPGRSASTATSSSSSRSTAPRARPSPGCATAVSSTAFATPKPVWNPDLPATELLPRPVAGGPGQRRVRQRLQGPVGAVPAARRRRRALPLGPAGRRPRRPARRTRPEVLGRGPPLSTYRRSAL